MLNQEKERYPYGLGTLVNLALAIEKTTGSKYTTDDETFGSNQPHLCFVSEENNQRILVFFTEWRGNYNTFVDVAFIGVLIHDELKPRSAEDSWQYFYITNTKYNNIRQVYGTRKVLKFITEFIDDSRKPEEERKFKMGSTETLNAGRWAGGINPVPTPLAGAIIKDDMEDLPDASATVPA